MPERGFATETWDSDEWFQELSRDQRYLFVYLWTNSHCNQAGLYHITLPTVAFESKFPKESLPELLNSLSPKVIWYPEDNLIWVKNFIKRQSKSPKFLAAAAKSLLSVRHNGAVEELLDYNLKRYRISIPYQYYMDKLSILTRASVPDPDPDPVPDTDKVLRVAKGEEASSGKNVPPSESEIEESLSEGDREVISVWRSVEGFGLNEAAAKNLVASLRTEFIDVDILQESKAWAVFAIDLGAVAAGDPNVPTVYRDPESFFRATYLTNDMRALLHEVLAALSGKPGHNRVLKLRTPFGGGKSHTLATLLHAARSRSALSVLPESKGLPDPGDVDVAVFDGEKFDARDGVAVRDGRQIRTMWGWLAWQLGEEYYGIVQGHDQDRVSPGGDVIKRLLTGKPKLFLLDEVLKYMERASSIRLEDSTLQRQALDFLHNLTVEVANSTSAAMVYSLQWSAREALGNVALLDQLDHLAARVDQLREPVTGDDILYVLQRRLLGRLPDENVASAAAIAYQEVVTGMRRAYAASAAERQQAEDEGLTLRERLKVAYPFHPDLIDIMRERWSSLDVFQRTRGALRFLASCLFSVKRSGAAGALLGPGDIPLDDPEVRVKLVKELGLRNEYDGALAADLCGPNARAKRIDERLARENPSLLGVRPAIRLATAIFAYSFGGLQRGEGDEALPPGVTEAELLASVVGPELDNITATAALAELRNQCLYLHYDGVRYAFKKDPNITKLIEDEEQQVARKPEEIRQRIKEMLIQRLQGHRAAIVWPERSVDLPNEDPTFLVGYLPLEYIGENKSTQERRAKELLEKYGERPRRYRNGVGLAIPERDHIEPLRRATRYLMAIKRIEEKKVQLHLNRDQLQQLTERKRTEEGAAESAFRQLYTSVWLPRTENGSISLELVEVGGRPLQSTGVHERVMELLTTTTKKVFSITTPRKIVELLRLGEAEEGQAARLGIKASDVRDAFFSFLGFTRLDSSDALRKAVARGVAEGVFAYASGTPPILGVNGKYQIAFEKVVFDRAIAEDEIDLDTGFLIMPSAIPSSPEPTDARAGGDTLEQEKLGVSPTGDTGQDSSKAPWITPPLISRKEVTIRITGSRDQLYKAWPAIANLADKAGKASLQVSAINEGGFDQSWLRNAVYEPLEEADVLDKQDSRGSSEDKPQT